MSSSYYYFNIGTYIFVYDDTDNLRYGGFAIFYTFALSVLLRRVPKFGGDLQILRVTYLLYNMLINNVLVRRGNYRRICSPSNPQATNKIFF